MYESFGFATILLMLYTIISFLDFSFFWMSTGISLWFYIYLMIIQIFSFMKHFKVIMAAKHYLSYFPKLFEVLSRQIMNWFFFPPHFVSLLLGWSSWFAWGSLVLYLLRESSFTDRHVPVWTINLWPFYLYPSSLLHYF